MMTFSKHKLALIITTLLLILATKGMLVAHHNFTQAQVTPAPPLQADAVVWGNADKGLRLGMRRIGDRPLLFEVSAQNTSEQDVVLNLGSILGNGQTQYPSAVELVATDAAGKVVTLTLSFPVAGRIDPFVVPLPSGATYRFPASMDRYLASSSGDRLAAGEYEFKAVFEGKPVVEESNNDMNGLKLMRYWTGRIDSGQVKSVVPATK